ncbi:MAG: cupin domain-containing protein [Alphaproteobacteria bacterium]|nr:cupin domain-containing protein [Alphaproteobacteria bacterium]
MSTEHDARLAEWLLGVADDIDPSAPVDAAEADALAAPLLGPPVDLPEALFSRLSASLEAAGPLAPFLDRVSALFALDPEATRALLRVPPGEPDWPPMFPGIRARRVPSPAGTQGALVWVAPGLVFPTHRHQGPERLLFLRGACADDAGRRYRAGDRCDSAPGTAHAFTVDLDQPLLFAVLARGVVFVVEDR